MYTACTLALAKTMGLRFLWVIPEYFVYVALLAWLGTALGLLRTVGSALRGP